MFKYRPHRGSLDEAMKEAKEFITMDQMFDYIVETDPLHILQKEDLYISKDHCKDTRIDWSETRYVMAKRYGKNDYPLPVGLCSMEDTCIPEYFAKAKNIYIGGFSRHRLLKMLYDAAKPYDKTISIDEAADALKNTVDMITELKGKKLYVNVFGKEFDGTAYDKINGLGLSYRIVAYMNNHPDLYTMMRYIHDAIQRDLYRYLMNGISSGLLPKIKSKPNINDVIWWNRPLLLYAIKRLKAYELDKYPYDYDWGFVCRIFDVTPWGETLRHFGRNYTEELKILKWNNWPDNWPDLDDDEIRYVNVMWNRIFSDKPYPSDFNNIKPKNPWLEKKTKRGK